MAVDASLVEELLVATDIRTALLNNDNRSAIRTVEIDGKSGSHFADGEFLKATEDLHIRLGRPVKQVGSSKTSISASLMKARAKAISALFQRKAHDPP